MSDLLDLLADEFPEIARARARYDREAATIAAVKDADSIVDTARALVTDHDDGSRTVHPAAALTVPALVVEIDRLRAETAPDDEPTPARYRDAYGDVWEQVDPSLYMLVEVGGDTVGPYPFYPLRSLDYVRDIYGPLTPVSCDQGASGGTR